MGTAVKIILHCTGQFYWRNKSEIQHVFYGIATKTRVKPTKKGEIQL